MLYSGAGLVGPTDLGLYLGPLGFLPEWALSLETTNRALEMFVGKSFSLDTRRGPVLYNPLCEAL